LVLNDKKIVFEMANLSSRGNIATVTGSYVDVPNKYRAVGMVLFQSARLPPWRPGFDSRPVHFSLVYDEVDLGQVSSVIILHC
jgi:hypothetical protein